MAASSPTHVFPVFLIWELDTILSKQLAAFPHRLLAHKWKTIDVCTMKYMYKYLFNIRVCGSNPSSANVFPTFDKSQFAFQEGVTAYEETQPVTFYHDPFIHLSHIFQKSSAAEVSENVCMWERVKSQ